MLRHIGVLRAHPADALEEGYKQRLWACMRHQPLQDLVQIEWGAVLVVALEIRFCGVHMVLCVVILLLCCCQQERWLCKTMQWWLE